MNGNSSLFSEGFLENCEKLFNNGVCLGTLPFQKGVQNTYIFFIYLDFFYIKKKTACEDVKVQTDSDKEDPNLPFEE